jgi:hypothetical protein
VSSRSAVHARANSDPLPASADDKVLPVRKTAEIARRQRGQRPNLLIAILMAVTFYALIYFALRPVVFPEMSPDFTCFYRAGKMVVAGEGGRVYDLKSQFEFDAKWRSLLVRPGHRLFTTPFVFTPFILAIFAPLSFFSYTHAEFVWYLLNVAMLASIPFLLRRRIGLTMQRVASDLVAPAVFIPVCTALVQGQPSILLLWLFTLTFLALREGNDFRAGCLLALAAFKPQLVLPLLLVLLLARKWKAMRGFASTGVVLFGVSVVLVGWHGIAGFVRAVMMFDRLPPSLGGPVAEHMPTVRGIVYALLQNHVRQPQLKMIAIGLSLAVMLPAMYYLRNYLTQSLGFSALIGVTLFTSYHCYLHDFSLLVLPIFLTMNYASGRQTSTAKKNLRLTVDLLFVIPAIAHWPIVMVIVLFVGVLALAAQQILELQRVQAGILTVRPSYSPRMAAS